MKLSSFGSPFIFPKKDNGYQSSALLAHFRSLKDTNPEVVSPGSPKFSGEVLAGTLYLEMKKLSEPFAYLKVIDAVLQHAEADLPNDVSQDDLMALKHQIARNMICNLYQDDRESTAHILSEEALNLAARKLLYVMDTLNGTGDPRGFKALEFCSMTDFLNQYLHGNHLQLSESYPPSISDWKVLDEVLNCSAPSQGN